MNPHPPTAVASVHPSFRGDEVLPARLSPRTQDGRRDAGIHLVNVGAVREVGAERSAVVVMARQLMRSMDRCSSALIALAALVDKEMAARHRLEAELQEAGALMQRMRTELLQIQTHAAQTEQLAYQDALTGLPNRASFEIHSRRTLSQHAPHSQAFGLMYLDLDGFKSVNDTHGHGVGDELLKVIGSRLAHAVRADDSVSRHGGDEFLCLLVDVRDEAQISAIAEKLFDIVSAPCQIRSLALSVTPSIGIALYPQDGGTIDALLEHADSAMFWAKKHHLHHAFYRHVPSGDKPRMLDGAVPALREKTPVR